MPMWRCPHCGTPQAETARCWVCHRSSTACGTCRHFRRSVAAQLGYCGLDRRRQPLTGDEIRGCWEAWPSGATLTEPTPTIGPARWIGEHSGRLEFIEVGAAVPAAPAVAVDQDQAVPPPLSPGEPGWSLWGDLDR